MASVSHKLVAAAGFALLCGPAIAGDTLTLRAESAPVPYPARLPGRHSVNLPALEFRFRVHVACEAGRQPGSLSLNIADSRKSLGATALDAADLDIELTVPARQVAPLVIDDFCVVPEDGRQPTSGELLVVPAVLSVQASLMCEDGDDQVTTYASRVLDVTLRCAPPPDEVADVDSSD